MAQEQDENLVRVLDGQNPPSMLGSEKFISWTKERFFKKKKDKEVPASKALAPDLETIIYEVSRYYKIQPSALKAVRRGIENEPHDVAIYRIRTMPSEPLMRIGAFFGLNRHSSASSAVMRIKKSHKRIENLKKPCIYCRQNNQASIVDLTHYVRTYVRTTGLKGESIKGNK